MNLNQIKGQIEETETLKIVAEAFTDIASMKLQRVRSRIEQNRRFASDMAEVLHIVRVTAEERGLSAKLEKKVSASLLVTSNKRFYYGVLDAKVADFFMAHSTYTGYVDRYVVGSVGRDYLREKGYNHPFIPVQFAGEMPTATELVNLATILSKYQKVIVYYPRFTSLLSQQPTFIDMTGFMVTNASSIDQNYYIFEPEIGKMLAFFEENIMGILLEQAFLESELARTGAQLSSMDQAATNAAAVLGAESRWLGRIRREELTMQVLENFAGLRHKKLNYDN